MNTLKIAYIGMGYRGKQLLALTRHIPYFQVTAIADPEAREADYDVPCYNQGGDDYQRMITLHAPQLHTTRLPCGTGNQRRALPA